MEELTKRVEELEELQLALDKPEIVAKKIQSFWNNESKRKLLIKELEALDEANVKEVDWDNMKRSYNNKSDKKAFLKKFHKKWLIKREHVVAKNQNLVLDNVILKRTKVAELHNIIGEKILLLPVPTAFFTGHNNGRKVQQLINWFRTVKE
ncbi:24117_t:CDS:2, partial [Gigaspora margarita]